MKFISLALATALTCASCDMIEKLIHPRAMTNREPKVEKYDLSACLPDKCGGFGFPCDEEGKIDLSWLDYCKTAQCDPFSGIIKGQCRYPSRKEIKFS